MPEAEVTPQGAQPSGAGPSPQGGKGNEEVKLTRAEFESLKRERDEARESERFWANRARSGGQAAAEQVDEPEEQIETGDLVPDVTGEESIDKAIFSDPDKWAEAVSKGPDAIRAYVRSLGLVTGKEAAEIARDVARRTVDVERAKMGTDAKIMNDFPELANPKSDLFKATTVELQQLVAIDPSAKNRPATLYAAAKAAKAGLAAKAAADRGRTRDDDHEDDDRYDRIDDDDRGGRNRDDDDEGDRRRRIDAQDGRNRSRDTDDDMDMVGPQAREVIRQMGITEKEYQDSRRELGVGRRGGRR